MKILVALTLGALFAFSQTPATTIVLQDVRLIDGTGLPPRDHVQITISDGKISEIRSALLRIAFPPNATILNLPGKTVIPGIINGHGHLGLVKGTSVSPDNYTSLNVEQQLAQYERHGVTTVISLGMNKDLLYQLRSAQEKGQLGGASILSADRGMGAANGMPPVKVGPDQIYRPTTPGEARKDVQEMASRDPNLIKIWVDDNLGKLPKQKPDVYAAAIDETHRQHLRIAAHVYYLEDAKRLIEDGVDILAHSVRDQELDAGAISMIKNKNVYYIPTLQLEESFYVYAEDQVWMQSPFFKTALSPELEAELNSPAYKAKIASDKSTPVHKQALQTAMVNVKKLVDAGAPVAFGTDSGANPYRIQGFAEQRELELLVQAGMTPLQAIHSATGVNAKMLHLDDKTGTIEKGKQADLLVLDSDPLDDITNTRKIDSVFHNGRQLKVLQAETK